MNNWISVEERLPDKPGRYLVYIENIANCNPLPYTTYLVEFTSWGSWLFEEGWETNKITHWMPFSVEPPESKTETVVQLMSDVKHDNS